MGFVPKDGDDKEPVGVISIAFAHLLFGVGIFIIGQKTKNRPEFFGGLIFFIIYFVLIFSPISITVPAVLALVSWVYVIVRFIWIYVKKETDMKIL